MEVWKIFLNNYDEVLIVALFFFFFFLDSLKILDLSHSHCLTKTLDFSKVPYLERLILKNCARLVEVHESIGHL
ncbi:hypothetical protein ACSBR1_004119 [Camellia fascicularis]